MPAAAVIPAPIAYIKVVAVKKLVVGSVSTRRRTTGRSFQLVLWLRLLRVGRQTVIVPGASAGRPAGRRKRALLSARVGFRVATADQSCLYAYVSASSWAYACSGPARLL